MYILCISIEEASVPDPDPMFLVLLDPDPDQLGRGMDYGSFYHEANIVGKTLIPTVL
jgi:hypothetical protein